LKAFKSGTKAYKIRTASFECTPRFVDIKFSGNPELPGNSSKFNESATLIIENTSSIESPLTLESGSVPVWLSVSVNVIASDKSGDVTEEASLDNKSLNSAPHTISSNDDTTVPTSVTSVSSTHSHHNVVLKPNAKAEIVVRTIPAALINA
jgi:hypothetical protein